MFLVRNLRKQRILPPASVPGSKVNQVLWEKPNIAASNDALTRRYFKKVVGHWSGPFHFQITDHVVMRTEVSATIDRLRLSMLHHMWPARMETSVSWANEEMVRHTTRIKSLGILCMNSEEKFHLNEDGIQFAVAMRQRLAPAFWINRVFPDGLGKVYSDCSGATYQLPWIGGVVYQHSKIGNEGVQLIQTSPWFSARVMLVRTNSI